MAILLKGTCPLMREALALGRECGLVYGVMWEAAFHDDDGECGGTTELSHKAIADLCHLGKATVIRAVDRLLDDGLIQFLHMVPSTSGSWKRRYRVTHPSQLEWQRQVIDLHEVPASERARRLAAYANRSVGGSDDEDLGDDPDGMYERDAIRRGGVCPDAA